MPNQPELMLGAHALPADLTRFSDRAWLKRDGSLVVPYTVASCFGGPKDKGDDGSTASGIRTDRPAGVLGVSLPMPAAHGCHGTPFAQLPWGTQVLVTCGEVTRTLPLVDDGPSGGLHPCRLIDITPGGWGRLLNLPVDDNWANWLCKPVSFVVRDVGRYFRDYWPAGVPKAGK